MTQLSELTVRAINIAVLSFCSLELFILLLGFPRFKLKNRASRIFYAKMLVSAFTIICYTISFIFDYNPSNPLCVITLAIAYVGLYAVYVLFVLYVIENVNNAEGHKIVLDFVSYLAVVTGVLGALIWVVSLFSPAFRELSGHHPHYGGGFALGHLGAFILILIAFILLIKHRSRLGSRETMVLMSMPILFLAATLAEPLSQGIELRYPAIVLEFLIVYTQHHLELEIKQEIQETKGMQQRMSLATGRMKPHYIYNILTTIYYLCESAPEKAQSAVGLFSEYLRSTLEAMERKELVEFSWELKEIRNYLALEKLRFGDRLNVEYDVEYDEFMLPPLTIQPLVENAVDHGIAATENGGTVRIVTRKLSDGGAQIRIHDNGAGFDVSELESQEFGHEGISNVRERLRREVGGDVTITSSPGKGTTAMITIRPQK